MNTNQIQSIKNEWWIKGILVGVVITSAIAIIFTIPLLIC